MSIAVLVQVHEESRRLAIAGAAVAGGDFRLKKLVPALEQAGAKVPVFARVAQAAQAVVESDEKTAAAALLDLASLVHAILYTQGETGIGGEFTPIETTDLGARDTQTSARVLKPLLEALKSTGSGRLELVQDAVERGTFKDLRLVGPALSALDDPYSEIASLIRTKVLPLYGKAIVPELRAKLNLKGRAGDVHRLQLLHALDPEGTRETIRQALDEGSKEIRVAAVECLDTSGDDLGFLLEQAKSKAKDIRSAALRALLGARSAAAEIVGAVKRAIDGADLELIVDRLSRSELPEVQGYVLVQAEQHLGKALAGKDPKEQGPTIARLIHLVRSLRTRTDARTEAFLLRCFEAMPALMKIKATPSGLDFAEVLVQVMARGTTTSRTTLSAQHRRLSGPMLPYAYEAARETMTPAAFYEEFSPLLSHLRAKRGKKGGDQERAEALADVLTSAGLERHAGRVAFRGFDVEDRPARREVDPRWLDAAVDVAAVEVVCSLARPGHANAMKFLQDQLAGTKPLERHGLLETMVRIKHPGAADAIIESLKQLAKGTHHGYYAYGYGDLIAGLPRGEHHKFEAFLLTLPEKLVDQLIESVLELKNKPE